MVSKITRITGLVIVMGVLIIGPLYRGLFFWPEEIAAIGLIALGAGLWVTGRRIGGLTFNPLGGRIGIALLLLVFAYLVQFFWAVYPWGNLDWVLRALAAWIVFLMLRAEASPTAQRGLAFCVVASSGVIAGAGLLHLASYYSTDPAVAATLGYGGFSDRLVSVYQYPNAAGAVFTVSLIIGAGLLQEGQKRWLAGLVGSLNAILSLALLFTLSRGAVAVLTVGLLVWIAGLSARIRLLAVIRLAVTTLLPVLVSLHGVTAAVESNRGSGTGLWLALAGCIGLIGAMVSAHLRSLEVRGTRILLSVLCAAAIVAGVGLSGWIPGALGRLGDFDLGGRNVSLRAEYVKDGLSIALDYPMGSGGWGWSRRYPQYQTLDYAARETHNHYVQTLIEAGLLGAVTLVIALSGAVRLAIVSRGSNSVKWALSVGAMVLAVHAVGDFTLSYLSIWLLMWALLGSSLPPPASEGRWDRLWPVLATGALTGALVSGWLWIGARNLAEAERLAAQGDNQGVLEAVAASRRFDPLNSDGLLLLDTAEALELATQRDPLNANVWESLAITYERRKEYRMAYEAALQALALRPAAQSQYEVAARTAGFALDLSLQSGDQQQVRQIRDTLLQIEAELIERQGLAKRRPSLLDTPALELTPQIALQVGRAHFLAGNFDRAEECLVAASKAAWSYASTADVWLHAIYEREGRSADQLSLANKPWIRFLQKNPVYSVLLEWRP